MDKLQQAIAKAVSNYELENYDDVEVLKDYYTEDGQNLADLSYYDEEQQENARIDELKATIEDDILGFLFEEEKILEEVKQLILKQI